MQTLYTCFFQIWQYTHEIPAIFPIRFFSKRNNYELMCSVLLFLTNIVAIANATAPFFRQLWLKFLPQISTHGKRGTKYAAKWLFFSTVEGNPQKKLDQPKKKWFRSYHSLLAHSTIHLLILWTYIHATNRAFACAKVNSYSSAPLRDGYFWWNCQQKDMSLI